MHRTIFCKWIQCAEQYSANGFHAHKNIFCKWIPFTEQYSGSGYHNKEPTYKYSSLWLQARAIFCEWIPCSSYIVCGVVFSTLFMEAVSGRCGFHARNNILRLNQYSVCMRIYTNLRIYLRMSGPRLDLILSKKRPDPKKLSCHSPILMSRTV